MVINSLRPCPILLSNYHVTASTTSTFRGLWQFIERGKEVFFRYPNILNRLATSIKHTGAMPASMIIPPEDAVQAFERMGGNLTLFSPFGADPLVDRADLVAAREEEFTRQVPDFRDVFHSLVNGNDHPFRDGFKLFLELTQRLAP